MGWTFYRERVTSTPLSEMPALPLSILLAAALLLSACGGGTPRREDRESDLRRAFQQIQSHEAELERHIFVLRRSVLGCEEGCEQLRGLRAQSAAICAIARSVMDADALTRCERSRSAFHGARDQVQSDCDCETEPENRPDTEAGRPCAELSVQRLRVPAAAVDGPPDPPELSRGEHD